MVIAIPIQRLLALYHLCPGGPLSFATFHFIFAAMPHLRFRGLSSPQVQKLTSGLAADLAKAMGTQPDNFTFEYVTTEFFSEGASAPGWPFVDVLMFQSPNEQKEACAVILTHRIRALVGAGDVTVIFQILEKNNYFENGENV